MKKVAWILGTILVLLIGAALIVPLFIDLNDYKEEIAAQAKEATGRDVMIDGDIALSILPMPAVSVEGVRFGNAVGGSDPVMASLDSVSVKVALMPLLSGDVQVQEIILRNPTILLEKLPDGTGNWEMTAAKSEAPATGTEEKSGDSLNVAIDAATIEGGTIIYRDAIAQTEQKFENLNADLKLGSLQGPFEATGGFLKAGTPFGFALKVGRTDSTEPLPIALDLNVPNANAMLGFSGTANVAGTDPNAPIIVGKLTGKGDSLAKLLTALPEGSPGNLPPIATEAFGLDGDVSAGATSASVSNMTVTLGDLTATTSTTANYENDLVIQTKLDINRLDLDKFIPAASQGGGETAVPQAGDKSDEGFSLPSGITIGGDISVQQIAYQGQAIENTKMALQLAEGQLAVKELSARLPGNTSATVSGNLTAENAKPNFVGALKLDSSNLRELIDAFAPGAVADVPADRLRQLAYTSRFVFTPGRAELGDISAKLDQSQLSGGIVVALPDGVERKQPGFGIGLSVDKLNLDGYLPKSSGEAESAAATEPGGNPLKALAPLADYDANLEFRASSLTLNQQQINGLHLLCSIANGALDIKDLSAKDFLGGKGSIAAKITDLKGNPRYDADFDITANNAGDVLQMAGVETPPEDLGALTLKGKAAGNDTDVDYDVKLGMAGIGLQGAAKGRAAGIGAGIPQINSDIDLKAKNIAPLAALAGLPADAAKQMGAVALTGNATSGNDQLKFDLALSLAGIGGDGKLNGTINGISGTPQIDTRLDLKAEKPAPLLRMAGLAGPKAKAVGALGVAGTLKGSAENMALDLDLAALGGAAKVAGTIQAKSTPVAFDLKVNANHPEFSQLLKVADLPSSGEEAGPLKLSMAASGNTDQAKLSGLDAAWGKSRLLGDASYNATGVKPFVTANMKGSIVDVRPFMAPSKGKGKGGGGGSPWSEEPLDLSFLDAQDADIDLAADSLIMPDQQIDNLVAKITVRDGVMTMNTLKGRIYGGGFDATGTTISGRGTPQVDAKVAVNKLQLSEFFGGGIAGNQIKGPLSFNLDARGAGVSEAEIMRSLAGKADLAGTVMIIGKLEQTVGSALLGVLGQQVKQVQGVTNTVNSVLASFTGVNNDVSGNFNIKQGVFNTNNLAFANPKGRGTAKGRIDAAAWVLKMLVDLYGANTDQAFMSINMNGPVDSPQYAFAPNGAAGPAGLMGLSPQGQFTPNNLLQQVVPGLGDLMGTPQQQPAATQPQQPGLIPQLPGVGDLLGQQPAPTTVEQPKKKKQQQQVAPEPGAVLQPAPEQTQPKKKKQQQQQQEPGEILLQQLIPQ